MDIDEILAARYRRKLTPEEVQFVVDTYADESEASVCSVCGDVDWYCETCGFHGHDCEAERGAGDVE